MSLTTFIQYGAATCSWIDPDTELPEVDTNRVTWDTRSRDFFVSNNGYRFCNFAEVSVQLDLRSKVITSHGFTSASRMYRGPSFARIPSHAFQTKQETFLEDDAVRFTQIVGARTVSPEVIGLIGGLIGETVAHLWKGFPPIWSKIQLRVYLDGRTEAQLLQHSLFPSLTFYRQAGDSFSRIDYLNGKRFYDATKDVELPDWQARGWGPLQPTVLPGPTGGNPWGTTKGVTGGTDSIPTPVR